jgi:bacterioferritin-associated ferredoxin
VTNEIKNLRAICQAVANDVLELVKALESLLTVEGDHMTACDKTMGATHPCTCGANNARQVVRRIRTRMMTTDEDRQVQDE